MQNTIDVIRANEREATVISDSRYVDEIKSHVDLSSVEKAENEYSELLKLIQDADLREKLDLAAGRISYAYEKLGFVEGYIALRSLPAQG